MTEDHYLQPVSDKGLFAWHETLRDLNMSEIQAALPEGTPSRSQKRSRAKMEAAVYGMSDENQALLIERARTSKLS